MMKVNFCFKAVRNIIRRILMMQDNSQGSEYTCRHSRQYSWWWIYMSWWANDRSPCSSFPDSNIVTYTHEKQPGFSQYPLEFWYFSYKGKIPFHFCTPFSGSTSTFYSAMTLLTYCRSELREFLRWAPICSLSSWLFYIMAGGRRTEWVEETDRKQEREGEISKTSRFDRNGERNFWSE